MSLAPNFTMWNSGTIQLLIILGATSASSRAEQITRQKAPFVLRKRHTRHWGAHFASGPITARSPVTKGDWAYRN